MILSDATTSLRRLLQSLLPDGEPVFSGSPDHWRTTAATRPAGLGLFLHRIEEVPTGMGGDWYDVRDGGGRVVARGGPARRFRLSYLLWAWSADDPQEEERLLSDALCLLAGHQTLPAACLAGSLADGPPARLALAPEGQAGPGGVWGATGLGTRTTLPVVLTADLLPALTDPAPLVKERRLHTSPSASRRAGAGHGTLSRDENGG
ncbi:Pvc16 family protein [Streptomyces sp. NPDC086023]|uniref:Pvc16 family protein n=1 Tax=Streptomyces sp. NPDC086023 TaxID=3365746 RepID=UPI0037D63414